MRITILLLVVVFLSYSSKSQISIIPDVHVDGLIDLAYADPLYYIEKLDIGKKALSY